MAISLRKKISVLFLSEPNFDKYACEFMILSLNKIQACFEFEFPELRTYPFRSTGYYRLEDLLSKFHETLENLQTRGIARGEYFIGITNVSMGENLFWYIQKNMAIITTDTWEKLFSPPSLFEYIIHSLTGALVQMISVTETSRLIGSHRDTRGCLMDYTFFKKDDKVDISLGYICDKCKSQIKEVLGKDLALCVEKMSSREWIGEVEQTGSVAHSLKKFFKLDLNKDTGFYKTFWERAKEHLPEIPKEVILIVATAIITYLLTK